MNKETKSYLPQDIITNIFLRLPVKSLIRFQCVCKNWKGLVQTPSFIYDHLRCSAHQSSFLFKNIEYPPGHTLCILNHDLQLSEIQKPPFLDDDDWTVVGSINGLICFELRYPLSRIYVWNPATKETLEVPRALRAIKHHSYYPAGFGFCSTLNDYKIVRLFLHSDFSIYRVEVFSLSKGSWKDVDVGNTKGVIKITDKSITCKGVVYWLALKTDKVGNHQYLYHYVIVSFDLTRELFTLIEMSTSFCCNTLTVFEEKLAMLNKRECETPETSSIDLWVMEGSIWIKICSITPYPSFLRANAIWRGRVVSTGCSGLYLGCVVLFNLATHEIEESMWLHGLCNLMESYSYSSYVESLVPVCNIDNIKLKDSLSRRFKYTLLHCKHLLTLLF